MTVYPSIYSSIYSSIYPFHNIYLALTSARYYARCEHFRMNEIDKAIVSSFFSVPQGKSGVGKDELFFK